MASWLPLTLLTSMVLSVVTMALVPAISPSATHLGQTAWPTTTSHPTHQFSPTPKPLLPLSFWSLTMSNQRQAVAKAANVTSHPHHTTLRHLTLPITLHCMIFFNLIFTFLCFIGPTHAHTAVHHHQINTSLSYRPHLTRSTRAHNHMTLRWPILVYVHHHQYLLSHTNSIHNNYLVSMATINDTHQSHRPLSR